ncbi:hypothetical protein LCGC14_0878750 [marine sediment metagenome]|uniref:Uncharacterized protein n=1 Tax=marine sediment metagenome TaxID=412755 RepID=A0A0F9P2I2_9ZZZZ
MNSQENVVLHSVEEVTKVVCASYPHKCKGSEHALFVHLIAVGILPQVTRTKKEDLPAAVLKELQLLVAADKE